MISNHQTNIITLHNGKQYTLKFSSLRLVKEVGGVLGIDIIEDGLAKLNFSNLLKDERKTLELLKRIFSEDIPDSILGELTVEDIRNTLVVFFYLTKRISLKMPEELKLFEATIGQLSDPALQEEGQSTSQSTGQPTGTQEP